MLLPSHERPAGHALQTRLEVAVGALDSYSLAAHVATALHEAAPAVS